MSLQKKFMCMIILLLTNGIVQAKFDATIPIVDMNDYYSQERHQIFINDLSSAMKTVGFVAVINSRVDKKILDEAYEEAKKFYAKPHEEKMLSHNAKLNGQRGYVQSEMAKGQNKKDHKEFYHIARDYNEEIIKNFNYTPNIWPNDKSFKIAIKRLINELDKYTEVIEQALAESIGREANFFTNMTKHGDFLLRSIYYPANPPSDTVWAAAHTDINLFTILPRATAEGLQILNEKNEWVDVIVPDNAFIINAGDMLQNITNGVYKSAKHRVISKNKDVARYSMVAFIHPRPNDRMDPLPEFIQKVGSRQFANATRNELLFERLIDLGLDSPQLLEQFAKSGTTERLIEVNRASIKVMQKLRNANLANDIVLAKLKELESNNKSNA
jgi:isopenicillin N synthase-like dioxygenase